MINTRLSLTNFRNHFHTDAEWGERINIITGPNGAGKTNLIDAVHYLCMGRSFTSSSDQYVVRQGATGFLVKGEFRGSIRDRFEISCAYEKGEGKSLRVNDSPLERHADLIGRVPVVLVSPDDKKLTGEGPAERRSFLDALIAQTSLAYLDDLIRYRKIVRQRNRLLSDHHHTPGLLEAMLEPWDLQLVETGARIVAKRSSVVQQFYHFLEEAHEQLTGTGLKPAMTYRSVCDTGLSDEEIRMAYGEKIRESHSRELERQQTLHGPHRDDLIFFLDDMELRKFGSQGQHRMFALALKMAQLYFYRDALDDLPVFLLDDVFGDLDPHKTGIVMEMLLQHEGQSFVTAAHPDKISGFSSRGDARISEFRVSEGTLISEKA
ncbi:DNA replication/repair protein RecF [Balneolales bacterium ANBcel1]|nr:DNA replication/repair protein RecF [Balneolales bacterium ANBcel1]